MLNTKSKNLLCLYLQVSCSCYENCDETICRNNCSGATDGCIKLNFTLQIRKHSTSLHYGKAAMADLESFCLTKTNSAKNKAPSGLTLSGGINSKNILFDAI